MSVYLVGAGPGDPGLITARGLELIRSTDVLVYDRLVAPELVDESPESALRIDRRGLNQNEINELLIAYGRAGLDVVRLKGGDPFVFGRGGEEALALAEACVAFEVVPGVSALAAVPGAVGIPVTHRGIASQVTAVTAHTNELDFDWLARAPGTLVFFMGLANTEALVDGLIASGKDPLTPAAIISRGTLPNQAVVEAPLVELTPAVNEFDPPALVVIGETVRLMGRLMASPSTCLQSAEPSPG